jgi:hypothetical protein
MLVFQWMMIPIAGGQFAAQNREDPASYGIFLGEGHDNKHQ